MKYRSLLVLTASLIALSACEPARERVAQSSVRSDSETAKPLAQEQLRRAEMNDSVAKQSISNQPVSLKDADAANIASQALQRKIIRNAALTVEVTSPSDSQHKIVSIAESHQGFVVTSEATQRASDDRTKPEMTVTLSVRVPAAQFNQ